MKIEMKTNIHNRFKIEVKRDNKIVQEGFAENIVLDRMYTRLMSFSSFFTYIHVGGGTGTLSPDRTTLFSPITYKGTTDDEKIKAYPTSSITKIIQFGTTEQNGKTFTEVGISESTSAINTHALIKDAEGNPLSITKTDIDVITIYATIFFELIDSPDVDGKFNQLVTENPLVSYVIDGSSMSSSIYVSPFGGHNPNNILSYRGYMTDTRAYATTRRADSVNRVNTYTTRIDTSQSNFDIGEISLNNVYRIDVENAQSWNDYTILDLNIGVGDGVTTVFELGRKNFTNLQVKINDITVQNYTLDIKEGGFLPINKLMTEEALSRYGAWYYSVWYVGISAGFSRNHNYPTMEVDLRQGDIIYAKTRASGTFGFGVTFTVSNDDINYSYVSANGSTPLTQDYKYLRHYSSSSGGGYLDYLFVYRDEHNNVVFDVPPPEGAPITVSYTVPYIPKTSDHVIDLSLDLHW